MFLILSNSSLSLYLGVFASISGSSTGVSTSKIIVLSTKLSPLWVPWIACLYSWDYLASPFIWTSYLVYLYCWSFYECERLTEPFSLSTLSTVINVLRRLFSTGRVIFGFKMVSDSSFVDFVTFLKLSLIKSCLVCSHTYCLTFFFTFLTLRIKLFGHFFYILYAAGSIFLPVSDSDSLSWQLIKCICCSYGNSDSMRSEIREASV